MPTSSPNPPPPSEKSSSERSQESDPSPPTLERGIREFNSGAFYTCHDTLEAIWMEAEASEKPFYQGILQIAVAFYHLGNLNWRGGAILMGEGISRLGRFEPSHHDVQVEDLVDQAVAWLELIQTAGADGLEALMKAPPIALPQVRMLQDAAND